MFGKEKRRLKSELQKVKDEYERFRHENSFIRADYHDLKKALSERDKEIAAHIKNFETLEAELNKVKREQTDADLFLLCQQIQHKILAGDKPTEIEQRNIGWLQNQRAALAQQGREQNRMYGQYGPLGGGLAGGLVDSIGAAAYWGTGR